MYLESLAEWEALFLQIKIDSFNYFILIISYRIINKNIIFQDS